MAPRMQVAHHIHEFDEISKFHQVTKPDLFGPAVSECSLKETDGSEPKLFCLYLFGPSYHLFTWKLMGGEPSTLLTVLPYFPR